MSTPKPIILHLGDDIKWNYTLYADLQSKYTIVRSHSMSRPDFIHALKTNQFGPFVAIYRPFWNTGGEMGNWDSELISYLPPSCRIFASAGAGFDWVDTKTLAENGIIYCNAAAACTESVADAAIWLILSTFRKFTWSALSARSCDVEKFKDANRNIAAVTHNPNGFSLGIIGLGRIGLRIAQKASAAFEMRVLYHDVRRVAEEVERSVGAEYFERLDDMLKVADCVLVATPFTGEKIMNKENFEKMKRGSRLVNIARGKLVDERALIAALESGQLFAAALDVHFDEPVVDPKLAQMENVEVLSHTAGASIESHIGFERLGMENIMGYLETGKAISPVNLQWLRTSKL